MERRTIWRVFDLAHLRSPPTICIADEAYLGSIHVSPFVLHTLATTKGRNILKGYARKGVMESINRRRNSGRAAEESLRMKRGVRALLAMDDGSHVNEVESETKAENRWES